MAEYTRSAAPGDPAVQEQLSWFTETVWQAAYKPGKLPAGLVIEGKRRLALLKAALKTADKLEFQSV